MCSRRSRSLVGAVCALLGLAGVARAEDPVLVNITGPLAARVGEKVSFEVELVNRSGRQLNGLRVVDYFDKGFHHAASASPIEQRGTIDMAPGTTRRLNLDFTLDEPGRQCHRVEILDQAHNYMGGATECVQVAAATVAAAPQPTAAPAPTSAPAPTMATAPAPVTQPAPSVAPAPVLAAPAPVAPTNPAPISSFTTPSYTPPAYTAPAPTASQPPLATAAPLATSAPLLQAPAPVALPQVTQPPVASPPPALQATAPALQSAPVPLATMATAPAATPTLELDIAGPAEVMSGAVGEFVATVHNTGAVASAPTKLDLSWEDAFSPLEASDGYKLGTSSVSWNLPAIEPGGQLRRQINLRPQAPASSFRDSPASRACVRGVLSGLSSGVMVADEACTMVRSTTPRPRTPREAGLRLSIADLDDPVEVGAATTVVCTVSNNGTSPSGRLDLVIVIPDQARLVGDPRPSRVRIDGSTIAFDSIDSIPPGGAATFEMSYRLSSPATAKATAILTGSDLDGSLESICTTSFLSPVTP